MKENPPALFRSSSGIQSLSFLIVAPAFVTFLMLTGCGGATAPSTQALSGSTNVSAPSAPPANNQTGTQNSGTQSTGTQNSGTQSSGGGSNSSQQNAPPPPPNQKVVSAIQTMGSWQWCSAKLHGQTCASGLGNAQSSMTENQQTPSLSGSSSMFWIGGHAPYSNALWWRELGPDSKPTHFTYDLYFYLDDATAPEALEFDVNQTISGMRYVWGTECSYRNTGDWQIWDSAGGKWFNTDVPCPQVSSKQWHHLAWQFERVDGKVHFINVTVDDKTSTVDKYFDPQKYGGQGISVAVQLDGDYRQTQYKLWVDKLTLTSW